MQGFVCYTISSFFLAYCFFFLKEKTNHFAPFHSLFYTPEYIYPEYIYILLLPFCIRNKDLQRLLIANIACGALYLHYVRAHACIMTKINSREPDNGMLYFTTYKKTLIRVVACNTTDGTILWQWASTSTSKLYAYGDVSASGLIYLSRFPRQMTTINATSGTTVTEAFFQLTRDCGDIFDQGPVLSGDERTVYQNFGWVVVEPQPPSATVIGISSDLKNASDLKATFYAYETVVNTVVPNSVSTGDNARIYFGCLGGKVYCIRPALSAPRIRPDANNNTVWVFAADGDVRAAVVLDKDEEVLYVGTLGSSFYALNASTGVLLWSFKTGGEIHSTAQISADGKLVYFGSRDNHIYAISTGKGKAERRA